MILIACYLFDDFVDDEVIEFNFFIAFDEIIVFTVDDVVVDEVIVDDDFGFFI